MNRILNNRGPRAFFSRSGLPIFFGFAFFLLFGTPAAQGQSTPFDPGWFSAGDSFVRLAVLEDGMYRVTGAQLEQTGLSLNEVDPNSLRLLENGREIPLWIEGGNQATFQTNDALIFAGQRNRGTDEVWAYAENPGLQGSTYHSLFSDTTWYWLAWGGADGLRYINTDPNQPVANPTLTSALRDTLHLEEDLIYYYGDSDDAGQPEYTRGEGFFWWNLTHTSTQPIEQTYPMPIEALANTNDSLTISVKVSSGSAPRHQVTLGLRAGGTLLNCGTCTDEADWSGYTFQTLRIAVPQSVVAGNASVDVMITSNNEFNSVPNRVLVDWIEASYLRNLNLSSPQQRLSVRTPGNKSFQLTQATAAPVTLFNLHDQRRFVIPATPAFTMNDAVTGAATYFAVRNNAYLTPSQMRLQTPLDLATPTAAIDYLIITTPALAASANELANYRRTADGYQVQVVFQSDIFNQFDYGRPTPLAIQRFLQTTRSWDHKPAFVTFWGDAVRPDDNQARRPLLSWEVISFGYSPSDSWFGMHLNGQADWIEQLAIGRIPLRDNSTGSFFVQKIANYESVPVGAWQKRMLMLVGGKDGFEQSRLQNHALNWGRLAVAEPTVMDTLRFFKTASDPLDPSFQDSLSQAFKNGASWVSYFGHSAADTWEIVTDAPEDYDNADRLPVVLSLGCNTGNFAGGRNEVADRLVYGERLVVASPNGAIAHWGSSSASTVNQPAALTTELHDVVFQDTTRILGIALQRAKKQYVESTTQSSSVYNVVLQYGLIGDPATRIRIADRPEFQVSSDGIAITPLTPVPADGALDLEVDIRSWGLIPADSVSVQLIQQKPDGGEAIFTQKLRPFKRENQLQFSTPIANGDVGSNVFRVVVDPDNTYQEVDELNNTAEKSHTVFSAGIALIAPADYAIVSTATPRLRATLATNEATTRMVAFELDTTPTFSSPALQSFSTQTTGLVADWILTVPLQDDQVYFWRARIEDADQPDDWQTHRFTVDLSETRTGWGQQHELFAENETNPFLNWIETENTWEFSEFRVDVRATAERGTGFEKGQFIVNGTRFENVTLGYGVLVIDGTTGELKDHNSFPTYRISEDLQNRFDTDSTRAVAGLQEMIGRAAPGDYIFLRTRHLGNLSGPTIQPEIKDLFSNLGSQAIDSLNYNYLWIMMTRAGFPAETAEWVEPPGAAFANEIGQDTTLFFMRSEGFTLSPPIGPAASWETLESLITLPNVNSSVRLDVVELDGETIIQQNIQTPGPVNLGMLDASAHPRIRLKATLQDTSQRATPQLEAWSAFFTPTAELAIDPAATSLSADTVHVGESIEMRTAVVNIGEITAALATLTYILTDGTNTETILGIDTLRVIEPDAVLESTRQINTDALADQNRIKVELNQPGIAEPFTLNNILIREFSVLRDNEGPRLEILIDNEMLPADFEPVRNLQDPALPFVSTQPTIEILITDENAFQPLNDTSLVQLELDKQPIPFSSPSVEFQPATINNNEARIFFTPDLSGRDTTHTLFLRVFDAAGNEADASPYQVHFRVQSAFEIESMYPYPNPMHTFTTFAFRLRGADALLADEFRMRIYTVTGRLIREFDLIDDPSSLETAALRIGWNKLRWDGRDADGDLVAPGVYLYKVFLKSDGKTLDVNNSSSTEKLVVLR